jgi:hypothetical protein
MYAPCFVFLENPFAVQVLVYNILNNDAKSKQFLTNGVRAFSASRLVELFRNLSSGPIRMDADSGQLTVSNEA